MHATSVGGWHVFECPLAQLGISGTIVVLEGCLRYMTEDAVLDVTIEVLPDLMCAVGNLLVGVSALAVRIMDAYTIPLTCWDRRTR